MRTVLALAICLVSSSAFAAKDLPKKDCSQAFVKAWQADKEAAFSHLPQQPCWMRTGSGPYVCYKQGCEREAAYFERD